MAEPDVAASFDPLRPRLVRIAYRMLGSLADAEDVVQDAYLRWHAVDRAAVREPAAFLRRTVTRLCLDVLKSAPRRHETYVGPWLPEPLVEAEDEAIDDITLPLMLALERLSPAERAAFLLHDVFGVGFEEIAETLDRDPAACRQLASRGRAHVRADRPRYDLPKARGQEIAAAFYAASRSGDATALGAMLAADVVVHSDGGGKRSAAKRLLIGLDDVLKLHAGLRGVFAQSRLIRHETIDGLPGFVTIEHDGLPQTTALEIEDDRIKAIYVMRNPDKLRHLAGVVLH